MNLADVMAELADTLDGVGGLRPFPFWVETISPPAVVVGFPDPYDYDETARRGVDTAVFPVSVLVSKADPRSAAAGLGAYADGAGTSSVKAALEAHAGENYNTCRVASVAFSVMTVGGAEYLAATFQTHISGSGSA